MTALTLSMVICRWSDSSTKGLCLEVSLQCVSSHFMVGSVSFPVDKSFVLSAPLELLSLAISVSCRKSSATAGAEARPSGSALWSFPTGLSLYVLGLDVSVYHADLSCRPYKDSELKYDLLPGMNSI